jgi:hypothetical protein
VPDLNRGDRMKRIIARIARGDWEAIGRAR